MAQKDTDLQKIKELIEIMKDNDLAEVEIKHGDEQIVLKRYQPQSRQVGITGVPPASAGASSVIPAQAESSVAEAKPSSAQQEEDLVEIKSPMVGTFYAKPSPDSDPFVELSSKVALQTVICIVEAMKVMNEIKAEASGTIAEILVTNGQAVEYGQVLFKVRPE